MINNTDILNNTSLPYYNYKNMVTGKNTTYPDQYLLSVLRNGTVNSLTGYLHSSITTFYDLINHHNKKEKLFLTAVDNLIKKNDFLQLTIQLDQELISDEEFQEEIENNEQKYLIIMNVNYNENDFKLAAEILPKLGRNFSVDEVSELFSIPIENIHTYLDSDKIEEHI